jgi:membrane protein implicated in regulation of membrane protease activity
MFNTSFWKNTPRQQTQKQNIFPNTFHWLGEEATVDDPIYPGQIGQVNYHGVWWRAKAVNSELLPAQSAVRILARDNLTLLVERK